MRSDGLNGRAWLYSKALTAQAAALDCALSARRFMAAEHTRYEKIAIEVSLKAD